MVIYLTKMMVKSDGDDDVLKCLLYIDYNTMGSVCVWFCVCPGNEKLKLIHDGLCNTDQMWKKDKNDDDVTKRCSVGYP